MNIELRHGSGGEETGRLVSSLFAKYFENPILARMEDGAVLPALSGVPVMTTDSFVVEPLFFPGGDIGRLAVCGTVNDLASMGARPLYLTAGFILETGLSTDTLEAVVASMAETAREAGVSIVAGDTKVVAGAGGLFINTAGLGERPADSEISAESLAPGDALVLSGTLGDHHATILTSRMKMETKLRSDAAPLAHMVSALLDAGFRIHCIRDITRGGLATVANELAASSGVSIVLEEEKIPVHEEVRGLCGILGLDPLTMGNEGKLVIALPAEEAEDATRLLRTLQYGENVAVVGRIEAGSGVHLETEYGARRRILPLRGEGLPRIC